MPISIKDNFDICNECGYPYSLELEHNTLYEHNHGIVDDRAFKVNLPQCHHLIKMPKVLCFSFNANMKYRHPFMLGEWGNLFGYDKLTRSGEFVSFSYNSKKNLLSITLNRVEASRKTVLDTVVKSVILESDKTVNVTVNYDGKKCFGAISECEYSFDIKSSKGILGISNINYFGNELIFEDFHVESGETPEKNLKFSNRYTIPPRNGNYYPYYLDVEEYSFSNCEYKELKLIFSAGIKDNKIDIGSCDAYAFPDEYMASPFVRLQSGEKLEKLFLWQGKCIISDPNSNADMFSDVMGWNIDIPVERVFYVENSIDKSNLSFGYEGLCVSGHNVYEGEREYLFDDKGQLYWDGLLLDNDIQCVTRSDSNKEIVKRIPKSIVNYDDAVFHAKGNHYFYDNEAIKFNIEILTKFRTEFLVVRVCCESIFGDLIKELKVAECNKDQLPNIFGKSFLLFETESMNLSVGVYHLVTDVFLGDELCHSHTSAFEVFDTENKISPQKASGLPHIHFNDGAPLKSQITVPDFWYQRCDFNPGHYVDCATYLPNVGEERRAWELLRLYKREWFAWMTKRSIGNSTYLDHLETIRNADYVLYHFPLIEESKGCYFRHDLWRYSVYTEKMKELIKKFLLSNPENEKKFPIEIVENDFNEENFNRFIELFLPEWTDFADSEIAEAFKKQWNEISEINPQLKRSCYGPIPVYVSPTHSGYEMKFHGFKPGELKQCFSGFLHFEDYPFCCDVPCYSGAWVIATTKLTDPDEVISPDLYGTILYSPDQFVAFAHPPLGSCHFAVNTMSCQMLEYAYATAFYNGKAFGFWNDKAFAYWGISEDSAEERMTTFLNTWRQITQFAPSRPLKSPLFIANFDSEEDVVDRSLFNDVFYNMSSTNMTYVYGVNREGGNPAGFVCDYDGFMTITNEDTDLLVVPSTKNAPKCVTDKIRRLHNEGVPIFAVSRVDGLEDIFGVEKSFASANFTHIENDELNENIFPNEATFNYTAVNSEVLLTAEGCYPVIIKKGNAVLLNVSTQKLGIAGNMLSYYGRPNISKLLKKVCTDVVREMVSPLVRSDKKSGLQMVTTNDGKTVLLVTDFTDNASLELDWNYQRLLTISIKSSKFSKLIPLKTKKPEIIEGIKINDTETVFCIKIRPKEALLFELA